MATTIIGLIVVLLYPLVLSAIAWIIFRAAITGRDGISEVVEALIHTNGLGERAKRATGFSQNTNGERPLNEKTASRQ
ncbi:hypothetical protein [Hyphomicrobium sp. ghe19]|uniref:hypothetical protein n=1 Tax=Hyphomicrobium sp. ghe19 TaxID=2682968 RepID=UPI0013669ABF|nr:hypothetical protein HYPP_01567 [Hyphomicrobium sp. ghe19]